LRTGELGHAGLERTERCLIPARAFVIRFPNGDFEYDFTRSPVPSVGEKLRRKGVLWLVTQITHENVAVVHVERVDGRKSK
jgi:hypothetical protein